VTTAEIAYLALVLAAFGFYSACLAYVTKG